MPGIATVEKKVPQEPRRLTAKERRDKILLDLHKKSASELEQTSKEMYTKLSDGFLDLITENDIDLGGINPEMEMADIIQENIDQGKLDPKNRWVKAWLELANMYKTVEQMVQAKQGEQPELPPDLTPESEIPLQNINENIGAIHDLFNQLSHLSDIRKRQIDRNLFAIDQLMDGGKHAEALHLSETLKTELQNELRRTNEAQIERCTANIDLVKAKMGLQNRYGNRFTERQLETVLEMSEEGKRLLNSGDTKAALKQTEDLLRLVDEWTTMFQTQEMKIPVISQKELPKNQIGSSQKKETSQFELEEDDWFDEGGKNYEKEKIVAPKKAMWPLNKVFEFFTKRDAEAVQKEKEQEQEVAAFIERTKQLDIVHLRNYIRENFRIDIDNNGTFPEKDKNNAYKLLHSQSREGKMFQALYLEFIRRRTELHKKFHNPVSPHHFPETLIGHPSTETKKKTSPRKKIKPLNA